MLASPARLSTATSSGRRDSTQLLVSGEALPTNRRRRQRRLLQTTSLSQSGSGAASCSHSPAIRQQLQRPDQPLPPSPEPSQQPRPWPPEPRLRGPSAPPPSPKRPEPGLPVPPPPGSQTGPPLPRPPPAVRQLQPPVALLPRQSPSPVGRTPPPPARPAAVPPLLPMPAVPVLTLPFQPAPPYTPRQLLPTSPPEEQLPRQFGPYLPTGQWDQVSRPSPQQMGPAAVPPAQELKPQSPRPRGPSPAVRGSPMQSPQPKRPPATPPPRSPPPSSTSLNIPMVCKVVLVGNASTGNASQVTSILRAEVQCTGSGITGPVGPPVNVTVGSRLLAFAATWRGVAVSQRPDDNDDDWGLTFHNVPYLQLRDSIVRDVPFSYEALLQCTNCSRLEFINVVLERVWKPDGVLGSLHGPMHASNVSYVTLRNFSCSDVREAYGWACLMLQYNTRNTSSYNVTNGQAPLSLTPAMPPQLTIVNCTFRNNSVARRGQYDTVHAFRPTAASGIPGGSWETVGLGMVVISPLDPLQGGADGSTDDIGGASGILRRRSVPSALSVTLSGVNAMDNKGGFGTVLSVIYMSMDVLRISRCSFTSNTATASGGVIGIRGPVSTVNISDGSQFNGNIANNVDGGALYLANGTEILNIQGRSSFMNNHADRGHGGAIRSVSQIGSLSVASGSLIDGNLAAIDGGAMALGGLGSFVMSGSSVMSNNQAARGGAVWIGSFAGSAAAAATPSKITLDTRSSMTSNLARDTGGAVAVEGGLGQLSVLRGSAFLENQAMYGGGAVAVLSGEVGGVLLAGASSIAKCMTVYGDGGGVFVAGGSLMRLELTGASTLRGNVAGNGNGGAVAAVVGLGRLLISNASRMCGNRADKGNGGGVAVYGALAAAEIMFDSSVSNNTAAGDGGAIWSGSGLGMFRIYATSGAANNRAVSGSGGFLFAGGNSGDGSDAIDVAVEAGSWLLNNVAGEHGGAMALMAQYGSVRLAGSSSVGGNVAERGNGGAIFLNPLPLTGGRSGQTLAVSVIDVMISSNRAGGSGGAIYLAQKLATGGTPAPPYPDPRFGELVADVWFLGIANTTLRRNRAGGAGGALLAAASGSAGLRVSFMNCSWDSNTAGGAAPVPPPAMASKAPDPPLARAAQPEGLRTSVGGAVALAGLANDDDIWTPLDVDPLNLGGPDAEAAQPPPDAEDYPFELGGNSGAVLYSLLDTFKALPLYRSRGTCRITIYDSAFSNNAASASGGALFLTLCTGLVDRAVFMNNVAGQSGGAVAAEALTQVPSRVRWWYALLARNSTFRSNTAQEDGGAVETATSGRVALEECTLYGNRALVGSGGGVAAHPPAASITSLYGAALDIVSCSVGSNIAGTHGGGIFSGSLSSVKLATSSISGNLAMLNGGGVAVVTELDATQGGAALSALVPVAIEVVDSKLSGNRARRGDGGALYFKVLMEATLTRADFTNNTAAVRGNAVAAFSPLGIFNLGIKGVVSADTCAPLENLFYFDSETIDCNSAYSDLGHNSWQQA